MAPSLRVYAYVRGSSAGADQSIALRRAVKRQSGRSRLVMTTHALRLASLPETARLEIQRHRSATIGPVLASLHHPLPTLFLTTSCSTLSPCFAPLGCVPDTRACVSQ